MKARAGLGLVALALAAWPTSRAHADETDECLTAPVEGQTAQKAGKLRTAYARFVTCANKRCPGEIVRDCAHWASEVEAATPSVVVVARDSEGHELADVLVSIDGGEPMHVGARAIPLDPGPHSFVWKRPGRADVTNQAVLHEGEKNREVAAAYPGAHLLEPAPSELSRPVPVSVWAFTGAGAAGLAAFGIFGALGLGARTADHCATGCSASQNSTVQTNFIAADVSLGVAVVALGIAAWQFFARPTVPRGGAAKSDAFLSVAPVSPAGPPTLTLRF